MSRENIPLKWKLKVVYFVGLWSAASSCFVSHRCL